MNCYPHIPLRLAISTRVLGRRAGVAAAFCFSPSRSLGPGGRMVAVADLQSSVVCAAHAPCIVLVEGGGI